jgi:hypothetical protein
MREKEEEGINRAVMDFKKENPTLLIVSKENEINGKGSFKEKKKAQDNLLEGCNEIVIVT